MATPILPQPARIACRDDLSFTGRTADEYGHLINWAPARVPTQLNQWGIEYRLGEAMAAEVQALHSADEAAAYNAICFAISSLNWKVGGRGAESGFAAGVAALAVVGMRALQAGAAPFDASSAEENDEAAEVAHGCNGVFKTDQQCALNFDRAIAAW